MPCIADLLADYVGRSGDSTRRDAEVLLSAALGKPLSYLIAWPEAEVPVQAQRCFETWMAQRRQGVPVAYLLGHREFWSLSLKVNPHTLVPRPDTETLIERALCLPLAERCDVLDLGTGSGAIALALASERPDWRITATDVSADALDVARANATACNLSISWHLGSWFDAVPDQRFDLVVSNPPYLAATDPHLQAGELHHEPQAALVAGDTGLEALELISATAPEYLNHDGWLLLEHGHEQGSAVRALLMDHGFLNVSTQRDLANLERVSGGRWPGSTNVARRSH